MIKKRFFDLFFTIPALILLAPFFLIISICIKLDSQGPVFFRQIRIGQHGNNFNILKFRTMQFNTEKEDQLTVGADKRITKTGKWLRHYKLDELPQLFNVLKGEMSIVGPRPEVPRYIKLYPKQSRKLILSVLPGITDLASIEFKNENEILGHSINPEKTYIEKILPKKIKYYEKYVIKHSLLMDLKIMFYTLVAIFSK
ncbi:MAG TPA: sugar transferase [Coxiellaceae bacterium]|nr:sugar transferase [Coxiellaceae bacterium]HBY55513.1 sugar transferase [Coxiellaceae bacterium]